MGQSSYKITTTDKWFSVLFNNPDVDGKVTAKDGNTYFTATKIPGETNTYQVNKTESLTQDSAKACADWLYSQKGEIAVDYTINAPTKGQSAVTQEVDDGYYLISSSLGTNLGLATADIPMKLVEKNTYPSIDKTQKDDTSANYVDTEVAVQVGDTIYYQVVVFVPATASGDITVVDKMSAGLTAGESSDIVVKAGTAYDATNKTFTAAESVTLTANNDYSIETAESSTYQMVIKPTDKTKGKYIQFTFNATVNSSAITDTTRENEVTLTYSQYKQIDQVKYDVYATGVVKYDGKNNTVNPDADTNALADGTTYLAGAEFQLLDKDSNEVKVSYDETNGYYYPDASGNAKITSVNTATGIVIRGLDNETYYLKETKAPDGFNLLNDKVTLTVTKSEATAGADSTVTLTALTDANIAKVQNNTGSVLPSTGGIGTTIFYIVGGILVVGAGVILVTRRRMGK